MTELNLKIPHGSIGVRCGECGKSSFDAYKHPSLLCKKHFDILKEDCADGSHTPLVTTYIRPKPNMKRIEEILSMTPKKPNDTDRAMQCMTIASTLGTGLTSSELTSLLGIEETNPKYKRRCSDLKKQGLLSVIGWRANGTLQEILAKSKNIDSAYFGKTILDTNYEFHSKDVKCGTCNKPAITNELKTKIFQLKKIMDIPVEKTSPIRTQLEATERRLYAAKEIVRLLLPE